MKQYDLKKMVGWSVLDYIKPGMFVGVGTGSTTEHFIDALSSIKNLIAGAVSSSNSSSMKLKKLGIPLFNLNMINVLDIYVDSADEINYKMQMIKGGGGALTFEKIISFVAKKFICIADISKLVNVLGNFPLPIEVIPIARSLVSKELIQLGGIPKFRKNVITENGNIILDIHNLNILDASNLEKKINNIPGVVTVGLFAKRKADLALISSDKGITEYT